jgi:hypothetical protein
MFDELDRLRANKSLTELLKHYASLGENDREAWQDRVMEREGADGAEIARLHGELLAFEWIEQNTGILVSLLDGRLPACYRITGAGLRALKRARRRDEDDEEHPSRAA